MSYEVRRRCAGRDRVEQGRAQRPAHLAGSVHGCRRHPGLARVHPERSDAEGRHHHAGDTDAEQDLRGQHQRQVAAVDLELGQDQHAHRGHQRARRHDGPRRNPRHQPAGDPPGAGLRRERHRQERQSGLERRVAQHHLEVVGEEQERAEHAGDREGDREIGAAAVAVEHDLQRQERRWRARFAEDECNQHERADRQRPDDGARAPSVGHRLGAAVDERDQAAGGEHDARDIETLARRGRSTGQHPPSADGGHHRDSTKAQARTKLRAFGEKIGYPEHWRDYSSLKLERGPLLDMVSRATEFETHRRLAKVGKRPKAKAAA